MKASFPEWLAPLQSDSERFEGKWLFKTSVRPMNVWAVGGEAAVVYYPAHEAALSAFLSWLPADIPVHFLGLGSNLLMADGLIACVFVVLTQGFKQLQLSEDILAVGAGVACPKVARYAEKNQVPGMGFFSGIPGTIGGALAMNAGAFGGETWPLVQSVHLIDRGGAVSHLGEASFTYGYRSVDGLGSNRWFIGASLRYEMGQQVGRSIHDCLRVRKQTQPIGEPSCGSVFRNPPGDYAGRLIEAAGLKGHQIGHAQVSNKHANFIINRGRKASAANIVQLIAYIQRRVQASFGIALVPEVRFLPKF